MLTKLTIQNFKTFQDVEIELGQNVVFVGPNNSGKTTALQALALWYAGLQHSLFAYQLKGSLVKNSGRPEVVIDVTEYGLTINRLDIVSIPVPEAELLWNDLQVKGRDPRPSKSDDTFILIEVDGITDDINWSLNFGFRYGNKESIYCVPTFKESSNSLIRMNNKKLEISDITETIKVAFLPPMSGLVSTEDVLKSGSINVRIGEGRTAEVLRNLCYQLYEQNGESRHWDKLVAQIKSMFGAEILPPNYIPSRGEIRMAYRDRSGITLDLSASGRGMLQVLLLLSYMYNNPGAVLLLDEPDAHLEIIRQREIYDLLTRTAREQGSQIIAATHSERILEEAFSRDSVIAFLGKPHLINSTSSKDQLKKALEQIEAADYYLAEQKGWVLYLEGSTDLVILQTFARRLGHPAAELLERCFVHYLEINKPSVAADHFQGLREAKKDLFGIALFDRISKSKLQAHQNLVLLSWNRREIENYLCTPETLLAYAQSGEGDGQKRATTMQEVIQLLVPPIALQNMDDEWWVNEKVSDKFLTRLFDMYFDRLKLPNLMRKSNYHELANFVPIDQINPEVTEKLDAIVEVAQKARPRVD